MSKSVSRFVSFTKITDAKASGEDEVITTLNRIELLEVANGACYVKFSNAVYQIKVADYNDIKSRLKELNK